MTCFRIYDESKRDDIVALFTKETEAKQAKLEAEALKKWEEDKKAEEAKAAEDAKNNPKGKAAPAKKAGGKQNDQPQLNVPKLEVPAVDEVTIQDHPTIENMKCV